jgi:hypothetical protein
VKFRDKGVKTTQNTKDEREYGEREAKCRKITTYVLRIILIGLLPQ